MPDGVLLAIMDLSLEDLNQGGCGVDFKLYPFYLRKSIKQTT